MLTTPYLSQTSSWNVDEERACLTQLDQNGQPVNAFTFGATLVLTTPRDARALTICFSAVRCCSLCCAIDCVLPEMADTDKAYESIARPVVSSSLEGVNG